MGFQEAIKRSFSIDLRTLAVFRVGLGVLLIVDLILRARDLTAHYTDSGVFPRTAAINFLSHWRVSIHVSNGTADFQLLLFLIAAVAALLLMIGWRTRLMTFISWFLLLSLQNRNPFLLQGGDNLLLLMLFWSMFLPLGARFSADAAMNLSARRSGNQYFSIATLALLIQFMSVYFFSAFLKSGPEWVPLGNATFMALNTDMLSTPIGAWATNFPGFLQALTYFVWFLELFGPVLIFSPVLFLPFRLAMQALLILMHVGFLLCLNIGLFPLISILSLLTFTPGRVWDYFFRRVRTRERQGLSIYYDAECDFCRKICLLMREFWLLPDTPVRAAQEDPDISAKMQRYDSWVVRDWNGESHVRWRALILVIRRSVWLWPATALLGSGQQGGSVGDRIYGFVARNRGKFSRVTSFLLPLRPRWEPNVFVAGGVASLFMLVILVHNISGLNEDRTWRLPGPVQAVFTLLRLDQKWNMFAPSPLRASKWLMAEAETVSGERFSFAPIASSARQEPLTGRLVYEYSNYRWRKSMYRISDPQRKSVLRYTAAYVCREQNATRSDNEKIETLKLSAEAIVTKLDWVSAKTHFLDKTHRSEDLLEFDCLTMQVR